jgi:teichuronic acid biosynthesis glycosyltransferase TuaH
VNAIGADVSIDRGSPNPACPWSSVILHSTTHDWYGRQHSYQAFARSLARRFPLLYVSTPVPWRRTGRGTRLSGGYFSEDAGVRVFAPSIPMGARFRGRAAWWRHVQDSIAARAVRRVARRIGFEPAHSLLLCMKPDALPLVRSERWAMSALWIGDDWEIPDMRPMLQAVDVVLAASPPTLEFVRAAGARSIAALGGGVEYEAFRDRPRAAFSAFSELRRPIVGYAGGLSARVDFQLLRRVAREIEGTLVLVGPVLDDAGRKEIETLGAMSNITWLGHKDEEAARDCVAGFDVGLIPYVKVRHTLGCNPAKLYEYLAAGVPVVATDLPLLRYFDDVIHVAADADAFVSAVRVATACEGKHTEGARRRRELACLHSYDAIVDLLVQQASRVSSGMEPIAPNRAWRIWSD